jgi:single-strand DNA-binding protein|tara:strand:+ start:909 stop:1265 length:357 start_codon:yes stop_codon:yes gene_type:complete
MNTISNYCRFIGKLVDNPKIVEFEHTNLCTFTLAITEYRKEKNGEKKKTVNFFDFEAWDSGGETISRHCSKGSVIDLVASARNNSWVDKSGQKRYSTKFRVTEFKFFNATKEQQTVKD